MKNIKSAIILLSFTIMFLVHLEAQTIDDVVSAEMSANRSKLYANEEFQITLAITSTGVSLDQQFQLTSMPDATRLMCREFKELPAEKSMQGNQIREQRRFCCDAKALTTGMLVISPTLRIGLVSGFGPFRQISRHEIRAKPLSIPVLPLPGEGKPVNFSGAVGQFSLDVEISPADVAVGDLITVITRIRGKGYLDQVAFMNVSPGANFKAYPARTVTGTGPGEKIFEQVLVPQNTNAVVIPPVAFSFFDPLRDIYLTTTKGPFFISFHPQRKASTQEIYRPGSPPVKSSTPVASLQPETRRESAKGPSSLVTVSIAAYWGAVLLVLFWVTLHFARGSKAAIGIFLVATILFLPLRNMIDRKETGTNIVIAVRTEKARLAPAYSAVVSFNVPRDSALKIVESYGSWSKVQLGEKKGWLPSDSLTNSIVISQ